MTTAKTHILIALVALVISACASNRDVAYKEKQAPFDDQTRHAQMIDGAASRIR